MDERGRWLNRDRTSFPNQSKGVCSSVKRIERERERSKPDALRDTGRTRMGRGSNETVGMDDVD